uniref:WGS project CBMI000000000 data, contig CS3069_c002356 n=1 Tax=Fusarium clavum TaxID=2594811 RepID=A0A090MCN4_9HYPO|nr:unnamed protein product [Fusarium clavum]
MLALAFMIKIIVPQATCDHNRAFWFLVLILVLILDGLSCPGTAVTGSIGLRALRLVLTWSH